MLTPTRVANRANRALHRQTMAAAGSGIVGLGLIALTLTHTARGTMLVTGCATWEAWSMSVGIDCAYVVLKTTMLSVSDKVRKQVGALAEAAIVGTLIGSACMNIAAFTSSASSVYTMAAGALMGAAIPALLSWRKSALRLGSTATLEPDRPSRLPGAVLPRRRSPPLMRLQLMRYAGARPPIDWEAVQWI
jgi:hypothetical protein